MVKTAVIKQYLAGDTGAIVEAHFLAAGGGANIALQSATKFAFGKLTVQGTHFTTKNIVVTGTGFTYDVNGYPTGGTITGISFGAAGNSVTKSKFNQTDLSLSGVSIKPADIVKGLDYVLSIYAVDYTGSAGADIFTASKHADTVRGGNGNDTLKAGAGNDVVHGNVGNDKLYGEDGNDRLIGGAGADRLYGGAGSDTASYETSAAAVTASLTTPASNTGDAKGDTYSSIENLHGSAFNDKLTGNTAANQLYGLDGKDALYGLAGNDRLYGMNGDDKLYGGTGRDVMSGGSGADTFVFKTATESGKTTTTRDIVTDFKHGQDKIDLSAIDANSSASGNQAFTLRAAEGAAFTGAKGQLIWDQQGSGSTKKTVISADLNGDKIADFQIELTGHITLTSGDFIL